MNDTRSQENIKQRISCEIVCEHMEKKLISLTPLFYKVVIIFLFKNPNIKAIDLRREKKKLLKNLHLRETDRKGNA